MKEMVFQSNYLINHRQLMTRDENRFFLTLVSQIKKDDDLLTYRVPVSVFAETWNIDRSAMYRKVKDVLESLRRKGVRIETVTENGKKRVFGCGFIADYEYIEGSALADVSISSKFKPYLLELQKQYTGYQLEQVVKLDAVGAGYLTIRIYEICSQWVYKKEFSYTVKHFKQVLDISEKYPKQYDFKRYVLDPAKKLINAETDLDIDYSISGRGSSAEISFTVERKQKEVAELPPTEEVPAETPEDVPDVPELPAVEPWSVEAMPEDWPDDYKELVVSCYEMLDEITKTGVDFTPDEIRRMCKFAGKHGASAEIEYFDYFIAQSDYIKANWGKIRNKKAYLMKSFVNNWGEWQK